MSYELELGDVSLICKCGEPLEVRRSGSVFEVGHKDNRLLEWACSDTLDGALRVFSCEPLKRKLVAQKRSERILALYDWTEGSDACGMIEALALLCEEVEELVAITRLPMEAKKSA